MSRTTIRDIAEKLGLGKSTVQRALTGCGSISTRARKRIVEAAAKLGYQPDPLFSILGSRGRRSLLSPMKIAYVCHHEFYAGIDVFTRAKDRGEALGYKLERMEVEALGAGKRLMDVLYHRGFVGVLIGPIRSSDHEAILANTHLPVVCCGRIDPLPLHTVQPDITDMVRLTWRRMLDAGYRRIGPAIGTHFPLIADDLDRLGAVLDCQR